MLMVHVGVKNEGIRELAIITPSARLRCLVSGRRAGLFSVGQIKTGAVEHKVKRRVCEIDRLGSHLRDYKLTPMHTASQ
jgi:hypothetical protein